MAGRVVARSNSIFGRATLTTDESMKAMLDPSTEATSTHLRCRLAHGTALGVERMTNSSQGRALRVLTRGRSHQQVRRLPVYPSELRTHKLDFTRDSTRSRIVWT